MSVFNPIAQLLKKMDQKDEEMRKKAEETTEMMADIIMDSGLSNGHTKEEVIEMINAGTIKQGLAH